MLKSINPVEVVFCIANITDLNNSLLKSHNEKVAYLSYRIAEQFGLTEEQQQEALFAGFFT